MMNEKDESETIPKSVAVRLFNEACGTTFKTIEQTERYANDPETRPKYLLAMRQWARRRRPPLVTAPKIKG